MSNNQTPEQQARNNIDRKLRDSGWIVQAKNKVNWNTFRGIAVKEYLTAAEPADYVRFVDKKPFGVIEAKKDEEGHRLTVVEEQSAEYTTSKLKYLNNDPLPFVYESTGKLTRFTDFRDPKPIGQRAESLPEKQDLWGERNSCRNQTACFDEYVLAQHRRNRQGAYDLQFRCSHI